jgi:molecular chaperone HtpG
VTRRYPDVPLEIIPVDLHEPVRARGVLFVTHNRVPGFDTAGVVDVYVRRMFVRESDPDLLPSWAKFVRGVIDSPDLQPNSARDNVRRDDAGFTALREALGGLILARLTRLASEEPERMARLCKWHHLSLKGLALVDDAFFDLVAELLFFESNRGPICLRDALRAPRTLDDSGAVPLYYVSSEGVAPQYYRMAEARDWLILDAGRPIDEALLRKFSERRPGRVSLVALDSEERPELFAPLAAPEAEAYRSLELAVEAALRGHGLGTFVVHARRFEPAALPAVVLATPQTEADHQLEAIADAPWVAPSLAELTRRVVLGRIRPLRLLVNVAHPLVRELARLDRERRGAQSVYLGLALGALLHSRKLLTDRNVGILHEHLTAILAEVAGGLPKQLSLPDGAGLGIPRRAR